MKSSEDWPLEKRGGDPETNDTLFDAVSPQIYSEPKGLVLPVITELQAGSPSVSYPLRKKKFTLGRLPGSDLVMEDMKASRQHAVVEYVNIENPREIPVCIIQDNNSRNGTYINGLRLSKPYTLKSGDRILIGSTTYWFFVRSELELEHETNLNSIMKKRNAANLDDGFSPNIPAMLQILFPEETFTPVPIECTLEFLSLSSMRVTTNKMSRDLYKNIIRATRYAKMVIQLQDPGESGELHVRISWLHYDSHLTPPGCTIGLSPEQINEEGRAFLERLMGRYE